MTDRKHVVDCVYLAACSRDARLTRICVASIRYFYPEVPIRLLAGDVLERGLAEELRKYWGVELVDLPVGDYGPGFVKLEPLFGPAGERFFLLDVDTVITGKVLDFRAQSDAPFIVDDENLPDAELKRLYYDWERLKEIDPQVQPAHGAFNVGHWFGTAGLLKREEFDRWVNWTLPRSLRYPTHFMPGDQGVLTYLLIQKEALEGLRVERRTIMRWPGNSMAGIDVDSVSKGTAPPLVVHWAGMKSTFLRHMASSELLFFFEKFYYERLPAGGLRRIMASCYHVCLQWKHAVTVRLKLAYRKRVRAHIS